MCEHQLMGFLRRRGKEKCSCGGGGGSGGGQRKQLSSCHSGTPIPLLKTDASVLGASIVFRDCRELCLAAFGIPGCPPIRNPGTLILSHCGPCLLTGSQPAGLPPPGPSTWLEGWVWFLITAPREEAQGQQQDCLT